MRTKEINAKIDTRFAKLQHKLLNRGKDVNIIQFFCTERSAHSSYIDDAPLPIHKRYHICVPICAFISFILTRSKYNGEPASVIWYQIDTFHFNSSSFFLFINKEMKIAVFTHGSVLTSGLQSFTNTLLKCML